MKRSAILGAALAAMALAGPAAAETQRFSAVYAVKAKGVHAGDFTLTVDLEPGAYRASASRKSVGLVRALVKSAQDYQYSASGVRGAQGLAPLAYEHKGGKRGRLVKVAFDGAENVTTADPPMGMGDPPASPAQRRGAIDQVTMMAALVAPGAGDPCGRTLPVLLDGRGRADFALAAGTKVRLAAAGFKGQGLECAVRFTPIAGFGDPQEAATLTFQFAPLAGGLYAPLRIEMPTDDAGVVTLEARQFQLAPPTRS